MYWRLKGFVVFVNNNRRNAFMNNLVNFLAQAGITVRVDRRELFDHPQGPACYVDICVEEEGQMDALWDSVTQWQKNWIVLMDVAKHRCAAFFEEDPLFNPPGPFENIYYRYP